MMTLDELTECCADWQARLRLSDWRIYLSVKRGRDFHNEGKAAEITMFETSKEATITLLDPLDYPPTCIVPQDYETHIVHELLHIHLLPCVEAHSIAEEQAIHCISEALVALRQDSYRA